MASPLGAALRGAGRKRRARTCRCRWPSWTPPSRGATARRCSSSSGGWWRQRCRSRTPCRRWQVRRGCGTARVADRVWGGGWWRQRCRSRTPCRRWQLRRAHGRVAAGVAARVWVSRRTAVTRLRVFRCAPPAPQGLAWASPGAAPQQLSSPCPCLAAALLLHLFLQSATRGWRSAWASSARSSAPCCRKP